MSYPYIYVFRVLGFINKVALIVSMSEENAISLVESKYPNYNVYLVDSFSIMDLDKVRDYSYE
jgi:hypothetical protein